MSHPSPEPTGPAGLVAGVERVLGGPPDDSLVVLPAHDGRSGAVLRFDLPAPAAAVGDRALLEDLAARAVGYALRVPGTTAMAAVVFRSRFAPDEDHGRALVDALTWAGDRAGAPLVVAGWRSATAWGVGAASPVDRWSAPRSLDELGPAAAARAFVRVGAIAPRPLAPLARRLEVERALRREGAVRAPSEAGDDADWPRLLDGRSASDDVELDAFVAARLLARMRTVGGRERLLAEAAFPGEGRHDLAEVWSSLFDEDRADAGHRMPTASQRTLDRAVRVLEALERVAPEAYRADALACLAWAEWAAGRASRAESWAEAADGLDPLHDLAALVAWMTRRGVVPPWFGLGAERP